MIKKHFLAVMVMIAIMSNMLIGCRQNGAANPQKNVFYTLTHQADSFGFTKATFYRLQAIFNQQQPGDFESAFYYYNYGCGYYHTNQKDDIKALQYADSMLQIVHDKADRSNNQEEIAIANFSKGDILFGLKRYNEACEYYYTGNIAAQKSGNQHTLSEYSYRLGIAMYQKENYAAAAHYFIQTFEQGQQHRNNNFSDFYRLQEVLNNIALSYLSDNKPDSALWYSHKGLRYIADNERKYGAEKNNLLMVANGVFYGTMGQAYLQMHDTTGAGLLRKSIAINSLPGRLNGDALLEQLHLAQYYLDTPSLRLPQAYVSLMAIQHCLDTIENEAAAIQWNMLMSRYYALQGNKSDAYDYLTRYNALHDRQVAANKTFAEINISSSLKELQSRYEMGLLKANNQLKTVYLGITVVLCLLTGVILFLIARNWKKERQTSHHLSALNKQIQQQTIQLEVTVKQLNEQIKTKDYILRVIAHDLRNPISAISTLTRIVGEEYENEEENKEFLEMAQSACKDSLAMIDSIMQLSQHGRTETLDFQVLDINETVSDCLEVLRFKAGEKQQEIVMHTADVPQYALADFDKLNRVISNLVTNAIKFSFPSTTIDVYVRDMQNNVEIEVKDEGIGIPENMQNKVFDVFTEAKRKGTSKESTFGLGLSICKQMIEAHGGKIWLESKEGSGSSFYIQLHKHTLTKQLAHEYEAAAV